MRETITLTEQETEYVKQQIANGRYSSSEEVVGKALQALAELDEEREQLLAEIRKGYEPENMEDALPLKEAFDEIWQRVNAARNRT